MTGSRKPDEAELRARLTYRVTQEKGPERASPAGCDTASILPRSSAATRRKN